MPGHGFSAISTHLGLAIISLEYRVPLAMTMPKGAKRFLMKTRDTDVARVFIDAQTVP